jgi:hypothetical protein
MVMRFKKILNIIGEGVKSSELVEIYYPKTKSHQEGWRKIEAYSLTTDLLPAGDYLIYDKDQLKPGHILNAYTVGSDDEKPHSFILGKIREARSTDEKFKPKWKIRF